MTKVMGIVNVTPDSFSDGGQFFKPEEAIRRAKNLIEDGAAIIDLGGESTRPGAAPLGWEEEWSRIRPVLEGLRGLRELRELRGLRRLNGLRSTEEADSEENGWKVSVDTYHPETAERAVEAGADIINCVVAESVPAMLKILDQHPSVELVLPATCLTSPATSTPSSPFSTLSTPSTLSTFSTLSAFSSLLPRLYLDPMIGFGTTREEDLALLRSVPELAKRGRVLVGASRKRIVKKLTGEKLTGKNLGGNLGIAVWCAMHGASVVRVHDVKETFQALRVVDTLNG